MANLNYFVFYEKFYRLVEEDNEQGQFGTVGQKKRAIQ